MRKIVLILGLIFTTSIGSGGDYINGTHSSASMFNYTGTRVVNVNKEKPKKVVSDYEIYKKLISYIIYKYEGTRPGYDKGGYTRFGLCTRYDGYVPNTVSEAEKIYYKQYYLRLGLNKVKNIYAKFIMLDVGINKGRPTVRLVFERTFGRKYDPEYLNTISKQELNRFINSLLYVFYIKSKNEFGYRRGLFKRYYNNYRIVKFKKINEVLNYRKSLDRNT